MLDRLSLLIAGIALIISAYQSWLSWNARDDHLEVIAAERTLSTCAEVATLASDYAFQMERQLRAIQNNQFAQASFDALKANESNLQKAYFLGTFVLGEEFEGDLDIMLSNGKAFTGAVFDSSPGDMDLVQQHFDAFTSAMSSIQTRCVRVSS